MNKGVKLKIFGILFFAAVLGYTVYALWFLGGRLNKVFGSGSITPAPVAKFNFEKTKEVLK